MALDSGAENFLGSLAHGTPRWGIVYPFPSQAEPDRERGDAVVREITDVIHSYLGDAVGRATEETLPADMINQYRSRGFYALKCEPSCGGRGLSELNTFRVISAAMSCSLAAGQTLALANGIGPAAYLSALRPGPLRDLICRSARSNAVSGAADTESAGGFNAIRDTIAEPTADGEAFVLTGEKVCIGNAPIADVLTVTATVSAESAPHVALFVVDAHASGLTVDSRQEFLGFRGVQLAVLRFEQVRVPKCQMISNPGIGWRNSRALTAVGHLGRMYIIAAPALAISRRCLSWSHEFTTRRIIDNRPLHEYQEVQRLIAETAADTFTIESIVNWCLLGHLQGPPVDVTADRAAAKNLTSLACWRTVERTMSLHGLEGYETAESKALRRVPATPLERAFRDARGLRIGGGIDFNLDNLAGRALVLSHPSSTVTGDHPPLPKSVHRNLSPANQLHLQNVGECSARLSNEIRGLSARHPTERELSSQEHALIATRRIAAELLVASLTLSRAATMSLNNENESQDLADIACQMALSRINALWADISQPSDSARTRVAAEISKGKHYDFLVADILN